MTQYCRPDSDIETVDWTTTPLFEKIDEVSLDDGDYIVSDNGSATYDCEVGLSSVTDPESDADHVISWRSCLFGTGTKSVATRVYLYEGATLRATSQQESESTSFATHTYELSSGEADAITDYSDLSIIIEAICSGTGTRVCRVSWLQFAVPDAGGPPPSDVSVLAMLGVG